MSLHRFLLAWCHRRITPLKIREHGFFLALVFMCGMLFQACVPRLCHLGWIWGGKVKACIQGWQRWWHRAMGNHQRERSPGTPLRNGILRHGTPTATSLAQFDRDKSSRHIDAKLLPPPVADRSLHFGAQQCQGREGQRQAPTAINSEQATPQRWGR